MLTFLKSTKCGPGLAKDFALVKLLKEQVFFCHGHTLVIVYIQNPPQKLEAWAVEPNLVSHIGAVSSLARGVNLNV